MDGDGGEAVEQSRRSGSVDLPSVLAQLDAQEPEPRRAAVRTIREGIDDRPGAYVPTVPKLRALLSQPELEVRKDVAYCLAELAREAPADVAPSVGELIWFAAENERAPATRHLLRCLAAVADDQPDAVADHVATVVDVLTARRGYDRWGLRTLAHVSREAPAALEPAVPLLSDALAANPEANGAPALTVLGRAARAEASLPSLAFVARAIELVDHDDDSVRRNAIGCLADVAHRTPSAVEEACPRITPALESDDPKTRANAAVTIGRVAVGRPDVVDPARTRLIALLEDEFPYVRANACVALGYGDVTEARERLSKLAAGDPEPAVRDRAAWACDQLS
ncbi:HEAT repeat domain-containing protein [Natronococcus wangiae]|uniref:HEAT repeat domain-containing protein n=1 Tax=Natronococcus wangiae TaxID=3068275 RepID=UPI00273E7D88|nr:HEAT repeat domain-containing protein [Natronococcus sp. AD5]